MKSQRALPFRLLALAVVLAGAPLAPAVATNAAPEQLAKGKYLTTAADCTACHTSDPAKPFAGGYRFDTPFGTLFSTNITPDAVNGIGQWTDDEFVRAVQEGTGRHGENLYPAMPFDSYTLMSREDILAIRAYLATVPPIDAAPPANKLSFPFNQRWVLSGWKLVNFQSKRFQPQQGQSDLVNRGNYLVNALEHCGACHTPRNAAQGMKDSQLLGGAPLGPWRAFNITNDPVSGIGAWTDEELLTYFKTGHAAGKASAAGGMSEAIDHSLRYLTDADLHAIIAYLRVVPPIRDPGETQSRSTFGGPSGDDDTLRGMSGITASNTASGGAEIFSGACASCHQPTGKGSVDGYYPALFHNSATGSADLANLVAVILNGVDYQNNTGHVMMPAFAEHLTDEQVAAVANYVSARFGQGHSIDARYVAAQRRGVAPLGLTGPLVAAAIVLLVLVALLAVFVRRRRRRGNRAIR